MRIIGGIPKVENLDLDSFVKAIEIRVKEDKELIRRYHLFTNKLKKEDFEY